MRAKFTAAAEIRTVYIVECPVCRRRAKFATFEEAGRYADAHEECVEL